MLVELTYDEFKLKRYDMYVENELSKLPDLVRYSERVYDDWKRIAVEAIDYCDSEAFEYEYIFSDTKVVDAETNLRYLTKPKKRINFFERNAVMVERRLSDDKLTYDELSKIHTFDDFLFRKYRDELVKYDSKYRRTIAYICADYYCNKDWLEYDAEIFMMVSIQM